MNKLLLQCKAAGKHYHDGSEIINVLSEVNFTLAAADKVAIVGPSGAGKSTFLHLLGGLDKATYGEVLINDVNWFAVSEKDRCMLRNKHLGFIYQFHHLLPEFTALENVMFPLIIAQQPIAIAEHKAKKLLNAVGLSKRLHHKPMHLSGGEKQRVAIARALVNSPACVLADEPTGNLDHVTAMKVFELILELNELNSTALVIVTHDTQLATRMNTTYSIINGHLTSQV